MCQILVVIDSKLLYTFLLANVSWFQENWRLFKTQTSIKKSDWTSHLKKITSGEGISPEVFNKDIGIGDYYKNKFIFLPTLFPLS